MSRPLIIDTDPGIDDALAILLACASPELELRALTTVAGNVPLARVTENALKLLELGGKPKVPVYPGADAPLGRKPTVAQVHGTSGMDGADLPAATGQARVRPRCRLSRRNPLCRRAGERDLVGHRPADQCGGRPPAGARHRRGPGRAGDHGRGNARDRRQHVASCRVQHLRRSRGRGDRLRQRTAHHPGASRPLPSDAREPGADRAFRRHRRAGGPLGRRHAAPLPRRRRPSA